MSLRHHCDRCNATAPRSFDRSDLPKGWRCIVGKDLCPACLKMHEEFMAGSQAAKLQGITRCALCKGPVGPDLSGLLMCWRCGPAEALPRFEDPKQG